MFLQGRDTGALFHIRRISRIGLGYQTRAVARVEDRKIRVIRVKGPDTIIVHGQGVHAATSGQRPDLDGLVGRCGHNRIPSLADEDIANIICVADKLGDQLPGLGVPDTDDILGPAAGEHRRVCTQCVDRTLLGRFIATCIDTQCLPAAVQIP